MLLPRNEVVHLLDLDPPKPLDLVGQLPDGLVARARPDLRRDSRALTTAVERLTERPFRAEVHGRRGEQPDTGSEARRHHRAGRFDVPLEGIPGAEPDHGPEAALLHVEDATSLEIHPGHPLCARSVPKSATRRGLRRSAPE